LLQSSNAIRRFNDVFFQQHASFDYLAHEADLNWLLKVVAFSKSTSLQGG
jgi:hypothetical protein